MGFQDEIPLEILSVQRHVQFYLLCEQVLPGPLLSKDSWSLTVQKVL